MDRRRPTVIDVLGGFRPAVFPVTVSILHLWTTAVSITDSNVLIPTTAVMDPVATSLAPDSLTVRATLSAGGQRTGAGAAEPPAVTDMSATRYLNYSSDS